jgi:hypothetical protein
MLGGSAAVLAMATGCAGAGRANAPAAGPAVALLAGAIQSEAELIALYDAVLAAHQGLSDRLKALRDHHVQHLAVLKRHYVPGSITGTAAPAPRPTATAPESETSALRMIRSAERKAAAARADEVPRALPGLSQLLAAIGACEAGHTQDLA